MPKTTAKTTAEAPRSTPSTASTDMAASISLLSDWNAEITRFYFNRYQQYWTLPLRLQSCRSPDDFRALQSKFLGELFDDYRDEASRLSQIAGAIYQQSDTSAETDYAASLLKAQGDAAAIIEQAKDQAERIVASAEQRAAKSSATPKPARTRKQA